ncbi:Putative odorant receptor 13a [Eufriesea mexicana]|uniref:Odorant receptor 13a n=1 Tax=Eufriesea mexicana TaxID=516756 RepID=A0A310SE80_9HYME|nr:Putative odorant receptor 13a [Eufriesea mexicana]
MILHSLLRNILTTMKEECQKYAAVDTNNLISKTVHMSHRLTTVIICFYMAAALCYAIGTLTHHSFNAIPSRGLLLKMDLPFETNRWLIYELVIIIQCFYQISGAFMYGIFSALLLMLVLHLGCQIDIMCQILLKAPYTNEEKLRFFVSRHQEIIIFSERIEQFFTYIALSQLVINTLIICGLGYIIVITLSASNETSMLIKCVLFCISICLEAFIYSFVGEYLSAKSKLIGDTAYEFLWYNLHPNKSRMLIPVILRSQKGFTFTCGKFAKLSMESFTSVSSLFCIS